MKNFFKLFGIIALVAVIGFSMTGCENDSDPDPAPAPTPPPVTILSGTWVGTNANGTVTISVSGYSWTQYTNGPATQNVNMPIMRGTYTVSGTIITMTATEASQYALGTGTGWVSYSSLTSQEKTMLGYLEETFQGSVTSNGSQLSAMSMTFTKQ